MAFKTIQSQKHDEHLRYHNFTISFSKLKLQLISLSLSLTQHYRDG